MLINFSPPFLPLLVTCVFHYSFFALFEHVNVKLNMKYLRASFEQTHWNGAQCASERGPSYQFSKSGAEKLNLTLY